MSGIDPRSNDCASHGRYYCHFFGVHPDDISLPNPVARWWPLWHSFKHSSDGLIDYGPRILFPPTTVPDSTKYIAWADTIPLLDPSVCLFGPFSFSDTSANPSGRTSTFRQFLPFPLWAALTSICVSRGIIPPVLSAPPTAHSRWTRSSRVTIS